MRLLLLLRATVVTVGGQLLVSTGAMAALGYQFAAKPWMRSWGATAAETRRTLPGDDQVPEPRIQITQSIPAGT